MNLGGASLAERVTLSNLDRLVELIRQQRGVLLSTWRQQVKQLPSARNLDTPTLNDHIPELFDELTSALQSKPDRAISEALIESSPPAHGLQRFREGYDIGEVVAEYNILRGCIHDLAEKNDLTLQGELLRIVNGVLDRAIELAVQTYAIEQVLEIQRRREEYLAFVAHDLRTPLNAIALAANVLETTFREGNARDEAGRMLTTLRRNVQHIQTLVEKIIEENTNLRADGGIKLERRNFDLWPLVEALIYDLRPVAKTSGTELANQVPHHLVMYADATLLRRVFQNLVSNAIKQTPRGRVVIGARECNPEPVVECWVTDTGAGFPQQQLERVFDELEGDSVNGNGLGLGLAIVKTFVEAHGGRVSVESTTGIGSTFRFTLPTKAECQIGTSNTNAGQSSDHPLKEEGDFAPRPASS